MIETQSKLERLPQPLGLSQDESCPVPGEGAVPSIEEFNLITTANAIFGYRWLFELINPANHVKPLA